MWDGDATRNWYGHYARYRNYFPFAHNFSLCHTAILITWMAVRSQWNNGLMVGRFAVAALRFLCWSHLAEWPFRLAILSIRPRRKPLHIVISIMAGRLVIMVKWKQKQAKASPNERTLYVPAHKILRYTAFQYTLCSGEMAVQQINTMELCIQLTFVIS